MIVILHVIIAVLSIGFTTYTYIRPSASRLHIAYGFVGATLASGIYLVWSAPSHMVQACMSGLLYLGLVSLGIIATKVKMAAAAKNDI
jgi:hypothetical protein